MPVAVAPQPGWQAHSQRPLSRQIMNKRLLLFCAATWTAAAILILGHNSAAFDALSGVIALASFDLLRP